MRLQSLGASTVGEITGILNVETGLDSEEEVAEIQLAELHSHLDELGHNFRRRIPIPNQFRLVA